MVRLFGRTARSLLTAGAIGVTLVPTGPAAAQTPPRAVNSVQVTTSQMRLEAMKVEMALLADHATYQLGLEVATIGDGLELRGNVADERLRDQAIRVARQACYLPVKDAMRVTSGSQAAVPLHTDAMRRTVQDVVQRTLDSRVNNLDVQIGEQGQVVLTGEVTSVEDKLAASRALKGMPGCQSVANCLSVQPTKHSGHTLTMVTRDGQHAVHGQLPTPEAKPVPHTAAKPVAEPAPQVEAPPPPPVPAVPTVPTAPPPVREVYVKLRSTNNTTYVAPVSGYATAPTTKPAPAPTTAPTPLPVTTPRQAIGPTPVTTPAPMQPVATPSPVTTAPTTTTVIEGKPTLRERVRSMFGESHTVTTTPTTEPTPVKRTEPPVLQPTAKPVAPAPAPTTPAPTAATPPSVPPSLVMTTGNIKWPPAHHVGRESEKQSATAKPMMTNSPAIRMAARPELAPKSSGYIVSAPTTPAPETKPTPKPTVPPPAPVVAAPKVAPSKVVTPAPIPVPPLPSPTLPVLKTEPDLVPINTTPEPKGLTPTAAKTTEPLPAIITPSSVSNEKSEKKATPALNPSQVYNLVKSTCGKLASAVRVESGPDTRLTVHIHATPGSEQSIIAKLLAVPEIASSNLRMQIHLPN